MIRKLPLIILLLTTAFSACTHKKGPEEQPATVLVVEGCTWEVVNDTLDFGRVTTLQIHDSLIIAYDALQKEKVHFFDRTSGDYLGAFGTIGQGDKDLVAPANMIVSTKANILSIYDVGRGGLLAASLSDVSPSTDKWLTIPLPDYSVRPREVYPIGREALLGVHGRPRLTLSRNGEIVAEYDEYPELPNHEGDQAAQRMFFLTQTLSAVSPDGTKMAQGTIIGSIMQIFGLGESEIELLAERRESEPVFSVTKGQIGFLPETIFGFAGLQATDDNIYATILGVANPTEYPSEIEVFDWEGNPVKKLVGDRQICCFCVDNRSGDIYAIVIGDDGEQHLMRLITPKS